MILLNKSEEFIATFDGVDYTIPSGQFDVSSRGVADHILYVSRKWGKDVSIISADEQISKINEEEVLEPTNEIVEEVVNEEPMVEEFAEEVVEDNQEQEIAEEVVQEIIEEEAQEII